MNGERRNVRIELRWSKWLVICSCLLLLSVGSGANSVASEEQPYLYLALGDSLTAGLGASEVHYLRLNAFVPKLTGYLREERNVLVENHGIPGITSAQLQQYIEQGLGVKQRISQASVITITIGGNDLLQLLRQESLTQRGILAAIEEFERNLEQVLTSIRSVNPHVRVYVMDLYLPYDEDHPLHPLGKVTIPVFNQSVKKQLDKDPNAYLVSVYDVFLGRGSKLTHIDRNDIHPNDDGYTLIFETFKAALEEMK
jgi:lysophospholipase L1-like esterase